MGYIEWYLSMDPVLLHRRCIFLKKARLRSIKVVLAPVLLASLQVIIGMAVGTMSRQHSSVVAEVSER